MRSWKYSQEQIAVRSAAQGWGADGDLLPGGGTSSSRPARAAGWGSMVRVAEGSFLMGSNDFYPEERPVQQVTVGDFWMDQHLVTNAEFQDFVKATGYVTMAERQPDPADYPSADPSLLTAGSLVFTKPQGPVDLRDYRAWWAYVPGADWQHPEGPDSTIQERMQHPVVHVAHEDALTYAAWVGKELPTEAEWERAARGQLQEATYVWGEKFAPKGQLMANTWQGRFPWENLELDGYSGTSPVETFPANGYGLYDMAGNVWEWTTDSFMRRGTEKAKKSCCVTAQAGDEITSKVVKGGSHLCAPNYCLRYRPAARQGEATDTSTCHIGFRCIVRRRAH